MHRPHVLKIYPTMLYGASFQNNYQANIVSQCSQLYLHRHPIGHIFIAPMTALLYTLKGTHNKVAALSEKKELL